MKKLIVSLIMALACCSVAVAEDGLTIWGMAQSQDNVDDWSQSNITARVGYRIEELEPFIASTWWPNYQTDEGDISPPQVYSLGGLYHWMDLIDPNNPIPWVPELLLTFLDEKMVAKPYFGGQLSLNVDMAREHNRDAGYLGAIIGIESKSKADSKVALITELQFNDTFDILADAQVPDEWTLQLGFVVLF